MGAKPRVRRTVMWCNNHLLINLWFLSEYLMKFNDIFHNCRIELFWFGGIIFVTSSRTEILHYRGISLGGRTLGTPVYSTSYFRDPVSRVSTRGICGPWMVSDVIINCPRATHTTRIALIILQRQVESRLMSNILVEKFIMAEWEKEKFISYTSWFNSTPEGRAVSVTRELDLSLLCRIWLFGRHLVSLAKIAEVWPPFFLATETPDIALEYTSREIWSE